MKFLELIFLIYSTFAGENLCRDIVQDIVWSEVPLIRYQEIPFQPYEVRRHGVALPLENHQALADYKDILLSRDGVYVFLFDRTGALLIDHQLPHFSSLVSDLTFYGTHRGLYNKRIVEFKSCEVVFAGELLVSNGRIEWISDNTAFYYDLPKIARTRFETERDFRFRTNKVRERMIAVAAKRLKIVHSILWNWGWADAQTRIKQVEKTPADFEDGYRNTGYLAGRNRARFESLCRTRAFCWQTYERIQAQLKRYASNGGDTFLNEHLTQMLNKDVTRTQILVQFLSAIREEGLIGVLAKQINLEKNEIPPTVEGFISALDWYLLELEILL